MARDHAGLVEVGPDRRQILFLHTEEVDALAAGDLHRRDVELVGDVGNGAQLARRRDAAPHPRHHRIGAVLLDVGVHPLIDVARLLVVAVLAGPGGEQIVVQRRTAGVAAIVGFPVHEPHDVRDGLQVLLDDDAADVVVAVIGALAQRLDLRRRRIVAAEREREHLLHQSGA